MVDEVTFNIGSLLAGGAAVATILAMIVIPTIRYVLAKQIDERINGKIDRIAADVDVIRHWTVRHDGKHDHRDRQLVAWMRRKELDTPDGWGDD